MWKLKALSEIMHWAVLIFIFVSTIGTECFSRFLWILTLISVVFTYSMRFIIKKLEKLKKH